MDITGQIALSRQSGLERELRSIANNLANMTTTGFQREGMIFSESVQGRGGDSVAMSSLRTRYSESLPGEVERTGGALDLAIDGPGFFLIEQGGAQFLTRAGSFTRDAQGQVVTPDGALLLDAGGTPVLLPPGSAEVAIAPDGTVTAGGEPVAQIALHAAAEGASFERVDGVRFRSDQPFEQVPEGRMIQGHLEGSNVSAVGEMTRMIEVQRAYEFAQSLQEREDERQRAVIRTLGQAAQ